MNPTEITENKVPLLKELEAAQLWRASHGRSSNGNTAFPAGEATTQETPRSIMDEALIAQFVEAWGVSWYKTVIDGLNGALKRPLPNHALIFSDDDREWRDARTGEGGNVFELHAYLTKSSTNSLGVMLEMASDWASKGMDVRPGGEGCDEDEFVNPLFPTDSLPKVIRDMVLSMTDVERLSPVLSALCCLAASSAALGNKLVMRSINGKTVCGNLFMMASAETCTGKTSAGQRTFAPINEFEENLQSVFMSLSHEKQKARLVEIGIELERADISNVERAKLCQEKAKLESSGLPQLTAQDVTSERLAQQMAANGECAVILGSEARSTVDMMFGRYRKKGETDVNFYLQAYSVERFSQSRISRGTVLLAKPCLTMLLLLQPDKFAQFMGQESLSVCGLLCRFLICDARATIPSTAPFGVEFPADVTALYNSTLEQLLSAYRMHEGELLRVEIDPEAWESLKTYRDLSIRRVGHDLEKFMKGFAGRWGENAFRMTLVFHAVQHGNRAHLEKVSKKTAADAINVVSWFANEQTKLIRDAADQGKGVLREKIIAYIKRQGQASARDVGRGVNADRPLVNDILEDLIFDGILKTQPRIGSGRNTMVYVINVGNKK